MVRFDLILYRIKSNFFIFQIELIRFKIEKLNRITDSIWFFFFFGGFFLRKSQIESFRFDSIRFDSIYFFKKVRFDSIWFDLNIVIRRYNEKNRILCLHSIQIESKKTHFLSFFLPFFWLFSRAKYFLPITNCHFFLHNSIVFDSK